MRFSEYFEKFEVFLVHPKYMKNMKKEEFVIKLQYLQLFYGNLVDNILGLVWYNIWNEKKDGVDMDFFELLKEVKFLPSIKNCSLIEITLLSITRSVERSFR